MKIHPGRVDQKMARDLLEETVKYAPVNRSTGEVTSTRYAILIKGAIPLKHGRVCSEQYIYLWDYISLLYNCMY